MKLSGARAEAFAARPDPGVQAVLVYGPDGGLVRERLGLLARHVVADPADPFRMVRLPAARIAEDPALLIDEAAAIPFGGGRKVVLVEDADDRAVEAFRALLARPAGDSPGSDAFVLAAADNLGPRSTLRLLFEGAAAAAALPCYADEGAGLGAVIREALGRHGLAADADALAWLSDHLGGDRGVTRSEIEKLALYMGRPGRVGLADATACVGDASALSLDELANAAAEGDQERAQRTLERLFREGEHAVGVLRALERHFQRLHLVAGLVAGGRNAEQAVAALRPPPHFRLAQRLRAQAGRWPVERAAGALDLLLAAEADAKTTGLPAEAICGRAVMQLAHAAARRRR